MVILKNLFHHAKKTVTAKVCNLQWLACLGSSLWSGIAMASVSETIIFFLILISTYSTNVLHKTKHKFAPFYCTKLIFSFFSF